MAKKAKKSKPARKPKSVEDVKHPELLYARTDDGGSPDCPDEWFLNTNENPASFVDEDNKPFKFTIYRKVGTGTVIRAARVTTRINKGAKPTRRK